MDCHLSTVLEQPFPLDFEQDRRDDQKRSDKEDYREDSMGDRCSFREESVAPPVGDGITYLSSNGPGALALSKTYRDSSRASLRVHSDCARLETVTCDRCATTALEVVFPEFMAQRMMSGELRMSDMVSQRTTPIQAPPDMVWIPGGTFRMGSEGFYSEERPIHE
jgi:hypothetical protein